MRNQYFIFIFFLLYFCSIPLSLFSQNDTINSYYFENLKKKVLENPEVKKVKYYQKYNSRMHTLFQTLFVKYKSSNKYFQVGKSFWYWYNKLAFISEVDINTKCLIDTAYTFYIDTSNYKENNIAIKYIYTLNCKNYIPEKLAYSLASNFRRFYNNMPELYKQIEYDCGNIKKEEYYRYYKDYGFALDSISTYYKNDGSIEKKVRYKMGKELSQLVCFPYKNGSIFYERYVKTDTSYNNSRNYKKAKKWLMQNFKLKDDQIEIDDTISGKITCNFKREFKSKFLWDSLPYQIKYRLKINVTNNTYNCEISDFQFSDYAPLEEIYAGLIRTDELDKFLCKINNTITNLLNNLSNEMKAEIK